MRVSVIIPNFNHGRFLTRAVTAALQSPGPDEIIVVDDASTDNSLRVLESLPVTVIQNRRNVGCNEAMNMGMALARNPFVLFTAADDELRPGVFAEAERMFADHPYAGVVCGHSEWRCLTTGNRWINGHLMPSGFVSPEDAVRLCRSRRFTLNCQNAVWRKSVLTEAGGWLPSLHWYADWFTVCVIAFRYGLCYSHSVLSNFNLSPDSYWNATSGRTKERTAVMQTVLETIESSAYADIANKFYRSGFVGHFGWQMAKLLVRTRRTQYLNLPTVIHVLRRCCEVAARKLPGRIQTQLLKLR